MPLSNAFTFTELIVNVLAQDWINYSIDTATPSYYHLCSFSALVQDIRAQVWPESHILVSAFSAVALLLFLR